MNDKPTIALHIGVHKTATTYIQSRLLNSIDILMADGIVYLPMAIFRSLVTHKLSSPQFSPAALDDFLTEHSAARRIVISDENIIGTDPRQNRMYPNAEARLSVLRQMFDGYRVEVFITLRSYPDYLVSRYTEVLRNRNFISFERFFKHIDFDSFSWLDLLADIKAAGYTNVEVTDFSSLFLDEASYFAKLLGQAGISLREADATPSVRRTKFSQEGFEVVRFFCKHYAPSASRQMMTIIDQTPQETAITPFMPIAEQQRARLELRYQEEIAQILPLPALGRQ